MKTRIFIICLLLLQSVPAMADQQLFMIRSAQAFPETMSVLQDAIRKQGYTVSRVQHVDVGLTTMGFKTDLYRVVFFAKTDELHQLAEQHPELVPYLPLQIAIFAEADETILVASNPLILSAFYPDAGLGKIFKHWHDDLSNIFLAVQNAD
jgi:uncharacterized protein (DUF302 family)